MSRRLRRVCALASVALVAGIAASAWAYFSSHGTATATALVGSINAPSDLATQQTGSTVTVTWNAASLSSGAGVGGYRVKRSDGTDVCGAGTPATTLSCTDTSVPGGTYTYTVTAVFHSFSASATSGSITLLGAPTFGTTPSNPSANSAPSFTFSGGGGTGYACKLDGGSFNSCATPLSESSLSDGSHTLTVHATKGSSTGPDTSYTWTIDTAAPSITAKPNDPSNATSPSFSFSHTESAYTFKCRLDGGSFTACTSPNAYSGLTAGAHAFDVIAVAADGSPTAAASYTWAIDTTAPTDSLSLAPGASGALLNSSGTRLYYKGDSAGSFKLTDTVSDSASGPASATFPAIATAGWTHDAETVSTGAGSAPSIGYTSSTFSWSANPSNPSAYSISSKDLAANNSTGITPAFVNDTSAPTAGALSVNGTPASSGNPMSYSGSTTFAINARTDYAETQSATQAGLASSTLTVQSATLSGGTCGSAGSGGPFQTATTIVGTTEPAGFQTGYCYVYKLTGTDGVGNTATISTTVEVDTGVPTTPTLSFSGLSSNAFYATGNNTLYFRSASGGAFTVTASSSAASGIAGYNFSSLSSNGFTGSISGGQAAYTFGSSATQPASAPTVSATSNVTRTSGAASYNLVKDAAAPTGGALTVNGTAATSGGASSGNATTSFSIGSRTDYTEAQSSTQSGLASSTLTIQSETLTGSTCGAAGSGGPFTSPTTISGTTQPGGIQSGYCYLYTLTGTDNVGNSSSVKVTVPVPTPVAVVSVGAANGGTLHKIGSGDTITITLSGAVNTSTICSSWSGTGNQSITGNGIVTVTLTDGGASDDTLTISASSCTVHFGTIDLGSTSFITSGGSLTYSGNGSGQSKLNYTSGSTPTLVITLGSGTDSSSVTASTLTYTPDASIRDSVGNAITGGSSSGQSF